MAGETNLTIIGALTYDPELRYTPAGVPVANFTVASNPRVFNRPSGEWRDGDPVFMKCSIWREAAENVANSLSKGDRVIVHGRLVQKSWEKDGERRTSLELIVDEIGPSLKWASAKVVKATRNNGEPGPAGDDEPPF